MTNSKEVLHKEVKLGLELYQEVLKLPNTLKDDEIMKRIIDTNDVYKTFFQKYPIVARYAVSLKAFNPKAFKEYLLYLEKVKPSDKERAECGNDQEKQMLWQNKVYAQYVKFLYRYTAKTHNTNDANEMYRIALENLNKDTKQFFKVFNESQKELEDKKKNNTKTLREEMKAKLKSMKNEN